MNATQKTIQNIKRKIKTKLKNIQNNNQIDPPNITTKKPNKMKLNSKNQITNQTKNITKVVTKILKGARPTGLAQRQHNKQKTKSSKTKSTHKKNYIHQNNKKPKHTLYNTPNIFNNKKQQNKL